MLNTGLPYPYPSYPIYFVNWKLMIIVLRSTCTLHYICDVHSVCSCTVQFYSLCTRCCSKFSVYAVLCVWELRASAARLASFSAVIQLRLSQQLTCYRVIECCVPLYPSDLTPIISITDHQPLVTEYHSILMTPLYILNDLRPLLLEHISFLLFIKSNRIDQHTVQCKYIK